MAIRRPPAFQFYAADYLADEHVQLMTLEEEGVYIRLLAYCWREGSIPANPRAISRLCKGASDEAVAIVSDRFEPMPNDPSRLIHPRLNSEREKQEEWSRKNALNGKISGKARREKKLHAERPLNDRMNKSRTKTNSSSSSSSSSSKKQIQPQAALVLPEWVPLKSWDAFVEMRKKGRWPLTDAACEATVADLDKLRKAGHDPGAVLMQSVQRCWRGVFELKGNGTTGPPQLGIYAAQMTEEQVEAARKHIEAKKAAKQ